MILPVFFSHELSPNFAEKCSNKDWAAVAALITALYSIDSTPYSAPCVDLLKQLQIWMRDTAWGNGWHFTFKLHPVLFTIDVKLNREDDTKLDVMTINVHTR